MIIIATGLCLLILPVYFILLMADGKRLQERLRKRPVEFEEKAPEQEDLLIELDYPMWATRPFCKAAATGGKEFRPEAP